MIEPLRNVVINANFTDDMSVEEMVINVSLYLSKRICSFDKQLLLHCFSGVQCFGGALPCNNFESSAVNFCTFAWL